MVGSLVEIIDPNQQIAAIVFVDGWDVDVAGGDFAEDDFEGDAEVELYWNEVLVIFYWLACHILAVLLFSVWFITISKT